MASVGDLDTLAGGLKSCFWLLSAPTTANPRTITTPVQPCQYDALIHEDTMLYCWNASTTFVGFTRVDLNVGTQTRLPLNINHRNSAYAGVWNEPWEVPGRIAYVACNGDDTVYKVDLGAATPAVVGIVTTISGAYFYHAREVEESQLTSWLPRKTVSDRNFHLDFGAAHAGKQYVLAPSLIGDAATPIILPPGLELWLQPDTFTILAAMNLLGYPAWGVLDGTGQADVYIDYGIKFNIDLLWVAVVLGVGGVDDVSNLIMADM